MSITITRMKQPIHKHFEFHVYLDDDLLVNIHDGETITMDIPSGNHKIFLEVNEVVSKKVKFELMDYTDMNFICGFTNPSIVNILASMLLPTRSSICSYIAIDEGEYDGYSN